MTSFKRLICLLMAMCLLAALCACAAGETPATEPEAPAQTAETAEPAAQTSEPEPAAEDTAEAQVIGKSGLRTSPDVNNPYTSHHNSLIDLMSTGEEVEHPAPEITAEPLTLPLATDDPEISVWQVWNNEDFQNDYRNTTVLDWVYDVTGVKLEINVALWATATEQFNLMMVAGATDDIIGSMSTYYTKGGQHALEESMCIDLTDYVAKYMPNYQAMRGYSDTHTRATMTDNGRLAYIYKMDWEQEIDWYGMAIRSDLLNELSLPLPVTYDDWTTCLKAMHETWGGYLSIPADGVFPHSDFASGLGIGTQWYVVDNKVHYGAVEPEYKEYLKLLRDWYADGLIDQDFMTGTNASRYGSRHEVVALTLGWGIAGNNIYLWGQAEEDETADLFFTGVPHAVKKEGDPCGRVAYKTSVIRGGAGITPAAEDPVLCCKFMDYFFSEEGAVQANYGPIGISCELDENENVRMTEAYDIEVQENIDNGRWTESYSWERLLKKYAWFDAPFGVMSPERLLLQYDDLSAWEQTLVWFHAHSGEWNYPEGTMMAIEENEEFASIYADAQTMIGELTTKIIAGMIGLDEGYDEMMRQLESINFERCIEIKQNALDNFYAR